MTVFKVLYVVIAILMIAFILLQRGAGAQQGGGFGAGASATVFGASGSANFLSRSTKWLSILFFGLSIAMAAMISHGSRRDISAARADAGVMSNYSETPTVGELPAGVGAATGAAQGETPVLDAPAEGEQAAPATAPVNMEAPVEPVPADAAEASKPVEGDSK